MALPTNNSRPAIPYNPQQILPNYDRYESLGQFPPTAAQLDGDLNKVIDLINMVSNEINNVIVGALPGADDPLNANNLMTTDGNGNISWVKVASPNLDNNAVTTVKIADAAITSPKIQPQSVKTAQLAVHAVTTEKITPGAVTTGIIAPYAVTTDRIAHKTIPLTKLQASGRGCFVVGDTSGAYIELPAPPYYQIPTQKPNSTHPTMEDFSVIWGVQQQNTLSGAPLADNTVPGSKIIDASLTGGKIADGSIGGSKIAQTTLTGNKFVDGTITGDKIAPQTITKSNIQSLGQIAPFAMGFVAGNGVLLKGINIGGLSLLSTGRYAILFGTPAPDGNYIVVFGGQVDQYPVIVSVENGSRANTGFNVNTNLAFNSAFANQAFSFVVYAY